jgi:hypothetical protein
MAREDISDITAIEGTLYVTCDAPGCRNETAAQLGTWFDGWVQHTRQTPLTTANIRDYCRMHAALADA